MKNMYVRFCDEPEDKNLVLATIVETKGSSPQVPGVSALFSDKGLLAGTLGGGIMEARAEEKALESLQTGKSTINRFELYADITSEEEAICGGEATILFDAQPHDHRITFQKMILSRSVISFLYLPTDEVPMLSLGLCFQVFSSFRVCSPSSKLFGRSITSEYSISM